MDHKFKDYFAEHVLVNDVTKIYDQEYSAALCLHLVNGFYYGDNYPYKKPINSLLKNKISSHTALLSAATAYGITARLVDITKDNLHNLKLPCIIQWNGEYCLLIETKKNVLEIYSPVGGSKKISFNEIPNSGFIHAFELSQNIPIKKEVSFFRVLLNVRHIKGVPGSIVWILILSLIIQVFILSMPLMLQATIDKVVPTNNIKMLNVLIGGIIILLLIEIVSRILRSYFVITLFTNLNIQTLSNLFSYLIRLPIKFFQDRHTGDITSRFGSLEKINLQISQLFANLAIDFVTSLSMIIIMAIYSLKLAFIIVVSMSIYVLYRLYMSKRIESVQHDGLIRHAHKSTYFMETLRAIQSVKIFQKEAIRHNGWLSHLVSATNKDREKSVLLLKVDAAGVLFFGIENIIVIYLISHLVMAEAMTIGMMYAFMSYKIQFSQRFDAFIDGLFEILLLKTHYSRVNDIIDLPRDGRNSADLTEVSADFFRAPLRISELGFRYSGSPYYLFKNISFDILPGESVAIIGPSGQGKTTLIKILMGLIPPTTGTITLNHLAIDELANYRNYISAVMQEDQLVSGTILENIMWFDMQGDIDFAIECAQLASVHNDILRLADGYDTFIGDLGNFLSGGQRQRIMLARALYKRPKILFLDEATSHLDLHNEKQVNTAIKKLNITKIIVAHRVETIKSADKIIDIGASNHVVNISAEAEPCL